MRVLTLRELNRATLARQLLLKRADLSAVQVIEHLVGIQAQWPQAPYIGIWTRTKSFRRDDLERELVSGAVVKANLMRMTLHLVSRRDYGLMRAMLSESRHADQWSDAKLVAESVRALAAGGPLTDAEALAHIEREHGLTGADARYAWRGGRMRSHILHHPETALWNARPKSHFAAVDEPEPHDPVEARAGILRRYLAAFGPATRTDIDAWSMLRMPQIKPALERIGRLRRYRDEHGRELLDVEDGLLPNADVPAPVRFLPKWDNVLLAWADRTRVLPEPYRKIVIRQNGDVAQTFLVDGFVAGTWRVDKGRVLTESFSALGASAQREVDTEAERLEAFLA